MTRRFAARATPCIASSRVLMWDDSCQSARFAGRWSNRGLGSQAGLTISTKVVGHVFNVLKSPRNRHVENVPLVLSGLLSETSALVSVHVA